MTLQVVARERLVPGLEGLKQTVDHIRTQMRKAAREWPVRVEAERLVRYAPSHSARAQIETVFEGLLAIGEPPYRYDPLDVELVRDAIASARSLGVDCDDFVVRAGALLLALGHPVELEVSGARKPSERELPTFSHIYLRVFDREAKSWITFDPVLRRPWHHAQLGDRAPAGVRMRIPMLGYSETRRRGHSSQSLDGPLDWLNEVGKAINKASDAVYNAVIKPIDFTNPNSEFGKEVKAFVEDTVPGGKLITRGVEAVAEANNALKPILSTGQKGLEVAAKVEREIEAKKATTAAPVLTITTTAKQPVVVQPKLNLTTSQLDKMVATKVPQTQVPVSPLVLEKPKTGMGTGLKVALGIGGALGVGGLVWALAGTRKRKRAA